MTPAPPSEPRLSLAERDRLRAMIARITVVAAPPLTPELRFHGATDYADIWRATEDTLARDRLDPPFWAFAWPGGQALARLLLDEPDRVRGRRVLTIGAGAGIEAIAAARSGARESVANDVDPAALTAAAMNAALNDVALTLDEGDRLGEPAPGTTPIVTAGDVVLMGDAYYERALSERLDGFARRAAAIGAIVYRAGPERPHPSAVDAEQVAVYDVPTPPALEDARSRRTEVRRVSGPDPVAPGAG